MPSLQHHDHACFVYAEAGDLRKELFQFVNEARERNEAVAFIHSFANDKEAMSFLEASGHDFASLVSKWFFLISPYEAAFEGGKGRIDFEHVGATVASTLAAARAKGRTGLRIFVDASRQYLSKGRAAEWFRFEEWLGRRLLHEVVLVCAYRREHATVPEWEQRILRTHLYRFEAANPLVGQT